MDADGDTDLVVGEYDPRIRLYQNVGSETAPEFGPPVYLLDPAFDVNQNTMTPCITDLDGDADLDLIIGSDDAGVRAYWNVGTAAAPSFSTAIWTQLIPVGTTPYNERWGPAPVDWDDDGDTDLLVGHFSGRIYFYRNDGGIFVEDGALHDALGAEIDVGAYARPAVTDWNGDGCMDLVVGNEVGQVWLFLGVPEGLPLPPHLNVAGWSVDDQPPLGDGDDVLNPGEEAYLTVSVANDASWGPVTSLTAVLGLAAAGVTVLDSVGTFGDCAPGDTVSNAASPFRIRAGDTVDPASYPAWIVAEGSAQGGASSYEELLPFSFDVNIWRGGWPKALPTAVKSSPLLADLDGDGALDVAVGCESGDLLAWSHYGSLLAGFPVRTSSRIRSAPSAADLTADGELEVVFCSYDDTLWVADGSGTLLLTKHVGESLYGSVVLDDIDSDGAREFVFGTWAGHVWAVELDGSELDGFPVDLGSAARMTEAPALADLDGDGNPEIVAMGADGVVHVFGSDGGVVPGWPFETGASGIGSPAVATFAGEAWVAVTTGGGDLILLRGSDGSEVARFGAGAAIRVSPVWADVDSDDAPDILFGSQDGFLHAVGLDGIPLPGWPVQVASMVRSAPAVADLDGDGDLEIVAACDAGCLYAFHGDGTPLTDWMPLQLPDGVESSPAVADLDGDGDLEIAVGTLGGVAVVDWKDQGVADPRDWTTHRANAARTAWLVSPAGTGPGPRTPGVASLTAAPNPSAGGFRLVFNRRGTLWRLSLYDLSGRMVDRVEGSGSAFWHASVAPGVYLARAHIRETDGTWREAGRTRLIKLE